MSYAPIIVSVYNRFEHFKKCIEALLLNPLAQYSDIFILSDAPFCETHRLGIEEIRDYVRSISGFNSVTPIFRESNVGAHISITEGIKSVLENYGSFIFLEDDIIVSSDFLEYMNNGLSYYKDDKRIFSVCGFKLGFPLPNNYNKDIFFYPCNSPWGFATWKDRWESVNHDYYDRYSELRADRKNYQKFLSIGFYIKGILKADSQKEIEASDLRVYYHMFQHNMCSVFPVKSKTQNWGFDGTGEHCGNKNAWWAKPELDTMNLPTSFILFDGYNEELLKNHREFQDKINGGLLAKWLKYTWIHEIWKMIKNKL